MQKLDTTILDPVLDHYPAWKRELILRKRANARGAVTTSLPAHQSSVQGTTITEKCSLEGRVNQQLAGEDTVSGPYYCSVRGPNKQLAQRTVSGPSILHYSADPHTSSASVSASVGCASDNSFCSQNNESVDVYMSSASGVKMHHKGLHDPSYCVNRGENGSLGNGEEDLQYGPGIVSKLKNRYLSLAMRETKARPALRRFSSLEDLLDAEETVAPRGRSAAPSAKREAMKRARSVDCLTAARRAAPMDHHHHLHHRQQQQSPAMAKSKSAVDQLTSFSREDIIIIEAPHTTNQTEPPPPVSPPAAPQHEVAKPSPAKPHNNTKTVFEPSSQWRVPPKTRPAISAPAKPLTPTGSKPVPKAKPLGLTARRPDSIQEAKGSLKQVTKPAQKSSPKSNSTTKLVNGEAAKLSSSAVSKVTQGSPVSKSVASPTSGAPKLSHVPPATGMRSEKSIESTRVLLENRKNAQKSRREEVLKPIDLVTPKAVVLVETTPSPIAVSRASPGTPPALPLRTIAPCVAVPPAPAPRLIPASPVTSPTAISSSTDPTSPIISTPTRQLNPLLSALIPSHSSTPNQSPSVGRYTNGISASPSLSQSPPSKTSPSTQKIAAAQPSNQSNKFSSDQSPKQANIKATPAVPESSPRPGETNKALPNNTSSTISSNNNSNNKSGGVAARPSARPPSPPINPNHFVSLKATAPKIVATSSPSTINNKSPLSSPPINNVVGPFSPSKTTSTGHDVPPSPIRTTKVTTFSSTGDEITEVIEAVNTVNRSKSSKDRWHQEQSNSLVFNFVNKKVNTPDYIENDGVDISKRVNKNLLDSGYVRLPGYDDCDSSTDDWDEDFQVCPSPLRAGETPPPCPFQFLGAAVIIKGRSNLQRQPRSKKLSISFNDSATKTFEYPSEASFVEDALESEDHFHGSTSGLPQTQGGVGLASYTPSKLILENSFELGVSRTVGSSPLPPTSKRPQPEGGEGDAIIGDNSSSGLGEDYLRPAGEEETVAWSAGGTTDMLF